MRHRRDAYGQYTNSFGAALVTTGPGATEHDHRRGGSMAGFNPMHLHFRPGERADLKGERGVRQMGFQEIDLVRMR